MPNYLSKLAPGCLLATTCAALIAFPGCATHAIFAEADHAGLLIEFTPNGVTPANIDLGVERGVVALIPQRKQGVTGKDGKELKGSVTSTGTGAAKVITVVPDQGELTSMYSWYVANVGIGTPIHVEHFLSTGFPAAQLVADPDATEYLWNSLEGAPTQAAADDKKDGK